MYTTYNHIIDLQTINSFALLYYLCLCYSSNSYDTFTLLLSFHILSHSIIRIYSLYTHTYNNTSHLVTWPFWYTLVVFSFPQWCACPSLCSLRSPFRPHSVLRRRLCLVFLCLVFRCALKRCSLKKIDWR